MLPSSSQSSRPPPSFTPPPPPSETPMYRRVDLGPSLPYDKRDQKSRPSATSPNLKPSRLIDDQKTQQSVMAQSSPGLLKVQTESQSTTQPNDNLQLQSQLSSLKSSSLRPYPPQQSQQLEQQLHHNRRNPCSDDPHAFSIVALGKCGEGKSTLLNTILGENVFHAKVSINEITTTVQTCTGKWLGKDPSIAITCIDTPAFASRMGETTRLGEVSRLMEACEHGVDAFLIVNKVTHYRYDTTIQATLRTYQTMLTPRFWRNVILMFTHADPATAAGWSESKPHLEQFASQIASQFGLPHPPPICFASDSRSFGKNYQVSGEDSGDIPVGITIVQKGQLVTLPDQAETFLTLLRELQRNPGPYYPGHYTARFDPKTAAAGSESWGKGGLSLGRQPMTSGSAEFITNIMHELASQRAFNEIDRETFQQVPPSPDSLGSYSAPSSPPTNVKDGKGWLRREISESKADEDDDDEKNRRWRRLQRSPTQDQYNNTYYGGGIRRSTSDGERYPRPRARSDAGGNRDAPRFDITERSEDDSQCIIS